MVLLDDEEEEPVLKAVTNYHFVDKDDAPISFTVLPFQFDDDVKVSDGNEVVFLRGTSTDGLQKVYEQVTAWKFGLRDRQPEVSVLLSKSGKWITLLRPRKSYENTIRTILITVQMLHFLRRNPEASEKSLWDHLRGVFDKFDVRPSKDDFREHREFIKLFAQKDKMLAKSQIFLGIAEGKLGKKFDESNSNGLDVKQPFIADDEEIEDENGDESDDDDFLFDSVCAICDNGGKLLCCEGPCMRSFHATRKDGVDSDCASLGFTKEEVDDIPQFFCKNCQSKQHQCFVCGKLESSDKLTGAKVFRCMSATCGRFYHPGCVAGLLYPSSKSEASKCEKDIIETCDFTCPLHRCHVCNKLEEKTEKDLQFAICRRCPRAYHRKCLPREIAFEDNEEEETRAWEDLLPNRILIYCLKHEILDDLETPSRDHIKFPGHPEKRKFRDVQEQKEKPLVKKRRQASDDSFADQPSGKPVKLAQMPKTGESERMKGTLRISSEKNVASLKKLKPVRKPPPELSNLEDSVAKSNSIATSSQTSIGRIPQSAFPVIDDKTEQWVINLVKKETSCLTVEDINRKCMIPSTHVYAGKHIDRTITHGKVEGSIQAVQAALQKLEKNNGHIDDAKAVCAPEVLRQLSKWENKLRVYLAPVIHGLRYTSFGRHFTKVDKLQEIVDKLHWYVQPGDTVVDFCCGANDFSRLMKEKLDAVQKKCNFKNYDVIAPKNDFCFEKKDWMTVQTKELPKGSQLIMGLNPPFGVKAALANKFINKALTFKPKLVVLIVPKETERLDRKRPPYDLIWEDTESLSGKSFYLPGSVDVDDKQMDQWNTNAPPLYLWSRSDWTAEHKNIAEKHNHIKAEQKGSHGETEAWEADQVDDRPAEKCAEATHRPDSSSGKERETIREESRSSVHNYSRKAHDQLDALPPEKQVEVAYEERKATPNRKESHKKAPNRKGAHRDAPSRKELHHEALNRKEVHLEAPNRKEVHLEAPNRKEVHQEAPNRKESHQENPNMKESHQENPNRKESHQEIPNRKDSQLQAPSRKEVRRDFPNRKGGHREEYKSARPEVSSNNSRKWSRPQERNTGSPSDKSMPSAGNNDVLNQPAIYRRSEPIETPDTMAHQGSYPSARPEVSSSNSRKWSRPQERNMGSPSDMSMPSAGNNDVLNQPASYRRSEPRRSEPIETQLDRVAHQGSYPMAESEASSRHSPSFPTDTADDVARRYKASEDINDLAKYYETLPSISASPYDSSAYNWPAGGIGNYRTANSADLYPTYRNTDADPRSSYVDNFPGHGRASHEYMQTSNYSIGNAGTSRFGLPAYPPVSSFGSTVGSAMDRYSFNPEGTSNYLGLGNLDHDGPHQAPGGTYDLHGYRASANNFSFAPGQQYPYPRPRFN